MAKPVQRFVLNFVSAAVWENDRKGKTYFKVTLSKSYKDGDEYKNTDSLDPEDLPYAQLLLQDAFRWIAEEKRRRHQSKEPAAA